MCRHARRTHPPDLSFPLAVDELESRYMLAGTVVMTATGAGDLILRGDSADNEVDVSFDLVEGELVGTVTGQAGTEIRFDGQTGSSHNFSLVAHEQDPFQLQRTIERDLRVTLGNGDDRLRILPLSTPLGDAGLNVGRNVTINMGGGNDAVFYEGLGGTTELVEGMDVFFPATIAYGRTTVLTGSGSDEVHVNRLGTPNLRVSTGPATADGPPDLVSVRNSGADVVDLRGGAHRSDIFVTGLFSTSLRMSGGSGDDYISVHNLLASNHPGSANVRLDLGAESNDGGALHDEVAIGNARVLGNLDVRGGAGMQAVNFGSDPDVGLTVEGVTRINLGAGMDGVEIANTGLHVFLGNFTANLGSGEDFIEIQGKSFFGTDVHINLQGGDDWVRFAYEPLEDGLMFPYMAGDLRINGGGGEDSLREFGALFLFGEYTEISIENHV